MAYFVDDLQRQLRDVEMTGKPPRLAFAGLPFCVFPRGVLADEHLRIVKRAG
ncbi:hypothetical protein GQB51_004733 [Salmonella enterica]|nr:hypothetical protein [Salmonella enterica]